MLKLEQTVNYICEGDSFTANSTYVVSRIFIRYKIKGGSKLP
jgi:hypothetical protein